MADPSSGLLLTTASLGVKGASLSSEFESLGLVPISPGDYAALISYARITRLSLQP